MLVTPNCWPNFSRLFHLFVNFLSLLSSVLLTQLLVSRVYLIPHLTTHIWLAYLNWSLALEVISHCSNCILSVSRSLIWYYLLSHVVISSNYLYLAISVQYWLLWFLIFVQLVFSQQLVFSRYGLLSHHMPFLKYRLKICWTLVLLLNLLLNPLKLSSRSPWSVTKIPIFDTSFTLHFLA